MIRFVGVAESVLPGKPEPSPRVSIGGAYGSGGITELIGCEDKARYRAKGTGRECVCIE